MKIHTREKVHLCQICKKSFYDARGLKKHMRAHTGQYRQVTSVQRGQFRAERSVQCIQVSLVQKGQVGDYRSVQFRMANLMQKGQFNCRGNLRGSGPEQADTLLVTLVI